MFKPAGEWGPRISPDNRSSEIVYFRKILGKLSTSLLEWGLIQAMQHVHPISKRKGEKNHLDSRS